MDLVRRFACRRALRFWGKQNHQQECISLFWFTCKCIQNDERC